MRIFNTQQNSIDIKREYHQELFDLKPNGLWYSFDSNWEKWARNNMPYMLGEYNFELNVDLTNILVINSFDDLKLFLDEFFIEKFLGFIKWGEVISLYKGIEINIVNSRFHVSRQAGSLGLYVLLSSLDVDSGCIWDLSCIKSFKLIENVSTMFS